MVLHLEFSFWATWQICQAAYDLAKVRSRASPSPRMTCSESDTSRRGGTYNERWGARRTGGAT